MTHPPAGPYGQPGPSGPQGHPGPWATGPGPQYAGLGGGQRAGNGHAAGYPAGPPQYSPSAPWGQPDQGPGDPWGKDAWGWEQPDPWGQRSAAAGDWDTPPKKKTGLIIGVVVAVVVLVGGGVTAAVLLTGKHDQPAGTAAPGGGTPPVSQGAGPSSVGDGSSGPAPGGSAGSAASVAQGLVASINAKNVTQYANLVCVKPDQSLLTELQADWNGDSTLHASLGGDPKITGSRATVTVNLTYHGQSMTPELSLKRQGSGWCADVPS